MQQEQVPCPQFLSGTDRGGRGYCRRLSLSLRGLLTYEVRHRVVLVGIWHSGGMNDLL